MMKFLPPQSRNREVLETLIALIKQLDCVKNVELHDNIILISIGFDDLDYIKYCIESIFDIKDRVDPNDCLYNYCIRIDIEEEDGSGNQI
ncbi:MAG: hypothetical protein QXD03_03660 [Candidatus Anstonellales archaeon]